MPESQDGVEQNFATEKEYVFALVQKEAVEIGFQRSDSFKHDVEFMKELPIGASVSFYMDIEGIIDLYENLRSKNLQMTELKTTWYGMQEFYVMDIYGYVLGFSEKA